LDIVDRRKPEGGAMRRDSGFTLIEIMIALIVVGVLAAVAIPNYTQYVQRSNQSAAQQLMVEVASRAEQYRLDAREYPVGLAENGGDLNVGIPDDVDRYYTVTLSTDNSATPPTYTVTATPRAGTSQGDMSTLTLNDTGAKSPSDAW
jgi:type IV pilus assembly protein PilE